MKNKEEQKRRKVEEIMPKEMLRDLMIENSVDKAVNIYSAWDLVVKNYNGYYYVPDSTNCKKYYNETPSQILGIGRRTYNKQKLSKDQAVSYMIERGVHKEKNIQKAWDREVRKYSDETTYIPYSRNIKRDYGLNISELFGKDPGKKFIFLSLKEAVEVVGDINSIDEWDEKINLYNKNQENIGSFKRLPSGTNFKKYFGYSFTEAILGRNINRGKFPLPIDEEVDYMIQKGIRSSSNIKVFWDRERKSYINEKYYIPSSRNVEIHFGKTIGELVNDFRGFIKFSKSIRFLSLHIEDLAIMDKPELLQLGMLGDLPKEEYKKLIDYPKGEEKVGFIKEMIERLKNPKENQEEAETFNEFLNEDTDGDKMVSNEETEFEKELHRGLEITKKPGSYNLEKQVSELFGGLNALDNFKNSDFTSEEAIEFIVSLEIQKLWNIVICNPAKAMKLIEEQMLQKGSSEFFRKVINEFLRQYNEVLRLEIPEGYSFPYQPTLMQKLTAYMILERKQAANWSETGSGKTLAGVLSSRTIDSRVTFVIAVNSTINNWTDDAIRKAYPDSKIYRKNNITETTILDRNFHNYVVINYEEFQNSNKFLNKWRPFLRNNKVDFVILDEIQKVKANSRDNMSNRRVVIENLLQEIDKKHGRDLEKEGRIVPVLALSATPVINGVNEGLSIISLLRGIDYTQKRNTRKSALACHFEIVKIGIRLTEEFPATERLITFPIKRDYKDILGINIEGNKNFQVAIDVSGCLVKIGECIDRGYLQPGIPTMIYTELVTDVIDPIMGFLQAYGFKVGEFTGRNEATREKVKEDFISGKYDVLLASKPITTGVNGLQKVCNRIIPIVLPWTYAEYHQLIGRLNRKGTVFSEVQVIIPTIEYANSNGDIWSLDNNRLTRIHYKQILADAIMNGDIPDEIITKEQAYKLAREKLLEWMENHKHGDRRNTNEIPVQALELKPTTPKSRPEGQGNQRDYFSEFQGINQRISTSTFSGVFGKIFKNKKDWENYHDLAKKSRAFLNDNPLNTIVRDFLKSKKHKVLGDMGCGMNQLKTLLPENYEVISVDMFAADETVKVCNLMDTSSILPNESLDIAVYCLSLWSRDWRKIIEDAYRILDYDGKIIIVEPISSQSKSIDKVRQTLLDNGFINILTTKDGEEKFYYMTASK